MFVSCSAPIAKFKVSAHFLNEKINTSLDSEIAKYYLEDYLNNKRNNASNDKRIGVLYTNFSHELPSRDDLKKIAHDFSVDFSALFFADLLHAKPKNKIIQKQFNQYLSNASKAFTFTDDIKDKYLVLFVPGWDYANYGYITGANLAEPLRLIRKLGLEGHLLKVPSVGSVNEIHNYLINELTHYATLNKDIILVGASSAGPAIYKALANKAYYSQQPKIKAWINLGGILKGSPLIDYYQQWPQSWLFRLVLFMEDYDFENINSLSVENSIKRFNNLPTISKQVTIINYMGLSLSGQLSRFTLDKYPLIKEQGPNDGLTLLRDIITPNSYTIVAVGSDHFFAEAPRANEKTVAVMKTLIDILENKRDTVPRGR